MDNQLELTKELAKFGLNKTQSLIYLALIQYGELRIQEIVNLTKIPRSSVYENLKFLSELGLTENIVNHKHISVRGYQLSVLRHAFSEKILHFQTLSSEITNLESKLNKLPHTDPNETKVRYYKGLSAARQLFWNTLSARSPIFVYSAYGRSKFLGKTFYKDFVNESKERKIKEQVLINPTERAINLITRDTGTVLARTKADDLRFLSEEDLLIKGETFIYDNVFAQIILDSPQMNGFEIESESLIRMQKSIFKTLWSKAKPLSEILPI